MPWWLIAIWSAELAWIVFWVVPTILSNYHGRRHRKRRDLGFYDPPNRWAYLRDRQVYLMEHSFKPDQCLCFRCVPNKWKGDWTYARDRADRNHRGNPGPNPVAGAGTLASSPSLGAAAQLAAGTSTGLISGAAAFSGTTYQWTCPACLQTLTLSGSTVQHQCVSTNGVVSITLASMLVPDTTKVLGLRHETLPRRQLKGVDYVMGFRSWMLEITGAGSRLLGHNGIVWDGKPAIHNGNPFLCHQSPLCQAPAGYAPGRACGYHAYDHWQRCPTPGYGVLAGRRALTVNGTAGTPDLTVNGICKMWGIIVRHGDGFRAQYAAPVALFRNASMLLDLRPIADALGLPLIDERDSFGVAREHGYVWGDPLPNSSSGVDEPGPPGAP